MMHALVYLFRDKANTSLKGNDGLGLPHQKIITYHNLRLVRVACRRSTTSASARTIIILNSVHWRRRWKSDGDSPSHVSCAQKVFTTDC